MSSFSSTLTTLFNAPLPHPSLTLIKHLKAIHPTHQHLSVQQCMDRQFPLSGYLSTLDVSPYIIEPETHCVVDYNGETLDTYTHVLAGVSTFTYSSTEFRVYKASWVMNHAPMVFYHLVFQGADDSVGQKLIKEVYQWANSLKDEIWVYENGFWAKNKQLYKAVRASSWDEIVLDQQFKDGLRRDTKTFFSSKDVYRSLGITWKRGILLLGPPGNGKTESIKALLKDAECAVMYAKSFITRQGPEQGVRAIFDHARQHAPCILVLEDLDAMVTDEVRSFFLNELDGLAQNDGILTIATTNHPERIDDAILNRPSRFDVKYNFTLPDAALRTQFAVKWIEKVHALGPDTGVSFEDPQGTAAAVADKTDGWSFAFLKELFVSFLLRVAHDKASRKKGADVAEESSSTILLKQIDLLTAQIIQSKDDAAQAKDKSGTAHPSMFSAAHHMMRPLGVQVFPSVQATHIPGRGPVHAGTNF